MSLIGPRPHALAHDNYFESILIFRKYSERLRVSPSLQAGRHRLGTVNGARGETPSIEHIAARASLNLWYINNWSFWLDIQILIKTFFEILRKRNAY